MDRGAWRAVVHGVAQGWTRPKQLSTHVHKGNMNTCFLRLLDAQRQ